jgi:hypothetical protein
MSGGQVAGILASLAAAGPVSSWAERLVGDCQAATQTSGVGLAVVSADGAGGVLAATPGHAQRMEDLQFALGEGPCVDACRSGRPVLVADLTREASGRWPAFTPEATGAGVHAAFTFPLQVGAIRIGALDLYRTAPGYLSDAQLGEALAFTDAAVALLLHLQDRSDGGADAAVRAGSPRPNVETDADVVRAVDRRAVVHQAAGMISVQLGATVAVALSRLRAHAYAAGRPILDVAADVVARRLRFDHSDEGATGMPDQEGPRGTAKEELS